MKLWLSMQNEQSTKKIILNNNDITDFYSCPVIYHARTRLQIGKQITLDQRGEYIRDVFSSTRTQVALDFFNKKFEKKDLETYFLDYLLKELNTYIGREQKISIYEIMNEAFFGPELLVLENFLRHDEYFNMKGIDLPIEYNGDNFIYKTTIPFIDKNDNLYVLCNNLEKSNWRYLRINILGMVVACKQNGINPKRIEMLPFYKITKGKLIPIPGEEQQRLFASDLHYMAKNILEDNVYPKPQWKCGSCNYETFCRGYRSD